MIHIINLEKEFHGDRGTVQVLKGINLQVAEGSLYTLLGPSGCGKTTTLRSVAGLEKPTAGEIHLDNNIVFSSGKKVSVPAEHREIGMVFQSYAIWPHMTVLENVMYPLEAKKMVPAERRKRALEVLERVGLAEYAHRPAPQLSGGQQQRVALARALVGRPQVLLFDEPLSNLDAKLRESLRSEIVQLQKEFGITALYVTHDQEEALALSDQIAIMKGGEIIEMGDPLTLYQKPTHRFTADFLGLANFIEGKVVSASKDKVEVKTEVGTFHCSNVHSLSTGQKVHVFFRPESVSLHPTERVEGVNVIQGSVKNRTFLGDKLDIRLQVNDQVIRGKIHPKYIPGVGENVSFSIDPEFCIAMPQESMENEASLLAI